MSPVEAEGDFERDVAPALGVCVYENHEEGPGWGRIRCRVHGDRCPGLQASRPAATCNKVLRKNPGFIPDVGWPARVAIWAVVVFSVSVCTFSLLSFLTN